VLSPQTAASAEDTALLANVTAPSGNVSELSGNVTKLSDSCYNFCDVPDKAKCKPGDWYYDQGYCSGCDFCQDITYVAWSNAANPGTSTWSEGCTWCHGYWHSSYHTTACSSACPAVRSGGVYANELVTGSKAVSEGWELPDGHSEYYYRVGNAKDGEVGCGFANAGCTLLCKCTIEGYKIPYPPPPPAHAHTPHRHSPSHQHNPHRHNPHGHTPHRHTPAAPYTPNYGTATYNVGASGSYSGYKTSCSSCAEKMATNPSTRVVRGLGEKYEQWGKMLCSDEQTARNYLNTMCTGECDYSDIPSVYKPIWDSWGNEVGHRRKDCRGCTPCDSWIGSATLAWYATGKWCRDYNDKPVEC
jgi:hypothetical protein